MLSPGLKKTLIGCRTYKKLAITYQNIDDFLQVKKESTTKINLIPDNKNNEISQLTLQKLYQKSLLNPLISYKHSITN